MPRKTKDAPGRVTPKGGGGRVITPGTTSASSGRYTPPIPVAYRSSPRWYPILILVLFGLGLLSIVCNYLGILPGSTNNGYLFGGLGLIVLGFIASTRYH
jgi:hypothetical protein